MEHFIGFHVTESHVERLTSIKSSEQPITNKKSLFLVIEVHMANL